MRAIYDSISQMALLGCAESAAHQQFTENQMAAGDRLAPVAMRSALRASWSCLDSDPPAVMTCIPARLLRDLPHHQNARDWSQLAGSA